MTEETENTNPQPRRKQPALLRPVKNRMLLGVCAAYGNYFSMDPLIIRLIFLVSLFFGYWGIILYVVSAIVIRDERTVSPEGQQTAAEDPSEITYTPEKLSDRLTGGVFLSIFGLYLLFRNLGLLSLLPLPSFILELLMPGFLVAAGTYMLYRNDIARDRSGNSLVILTAYVLILSGLMYLLNLAGFVRIDSAGVTAYSFLVFGIASVYMNMNSGRKWILFVSACIFFTGVELFVLEKFEIIGSGSIIFPSLLMIPGLGFLMVFIDQPQHRKEIVYSIVLICLSALIIIFYRSVQLISLINSVFTELRDYYPAALIVLGLVLIFVKPARR